MRCEDRKSEEKMFEKWIQDKLMQDPDDIDALLEAADLTRQLIHDRDYDGISTMIRCTVENSLYECFSWITDLLQEEFEKPEGSDLADFICDIGRSVPDFDEFAERLQLDFRVQKHDVEKVYDEHGEAEAFFNNFTYRTKYKNIDLVTSENFDTKDNDYIQYKLKFGR